MATVDDFKEAVRDHLSRNGTLNRMRASVRAEIIHSLAEPTSTRTEAKPRDTYVINELIREYLSFHGYRSTLSVFEPESGLPQAGALDRDFVADRMQLRLGQQSEQLPLLYSMVQKLSETPST